MWMTIAALVLIAQEPLVARLETSSQDRAVATGRKPWVELGGDSARPHAVVVTGTVELTPFEAQAAAAAEAKRLVGQQLTARAYAIADQATPIWLPKYRAERVVNGWIGQQERRASVRILDRDETVRDHGFGKSFQTTLLVEPEILRGADQDSLLQAWLAREAKRFGFCCGGIVLFWGLLSLATGWLDRLTRGYMTWRLRGIAGCLGVVLPAVVLLL